MKKRYILGSVIVALLMLVSTQIMFVNIVKSYPEAHDGDAVAGTLWLSELDVSGDLTTIDYIGIPHANATDDWVYWVSGKDDVIANWSVDIDNNHPEYYVIFSLLVCNVDNGNVVVGSDWFQKTYNADTSYDESGNLLCEINLSTPLQAAGEQTLVCHLGAIVTINDTSEAKNFTIWSDDRCVIGVDSQRPTTESFGPFVEESNENYEPLWAYLSGWGIRFGSEDDMLNNQTAVVPGVIRSCGNENWDLGKFDVYYDWNGKDLDETEWIIHDPYVTWTPGETWVEGPATWDWEVNDHPNHKDPILVMKVKLDIVPPDEPGRAMRSRQFWFDAFSENEDTKNCNVLVELSHDETPTGEIAITGHAEARNIYDKVVWGFAGYKIYLQEEGVPPGSNYDIVNWYYDLAYSEGTYGITMSGTTEISVDITQGITSPVEEILYIFAGDAGETTVTLTV